jgi:kinetochore protein Nuf2
MADLKASLEEEINLAKIQYDKLHAHIELYMSKVDQYITTASSS